MISPSPDADKQTLREHFRNARCAPADDASLIAHTDRFLRTFEHPRVAAYAPLASEPGGKEWLAAVAAACQQVWLPLSMPGGTLLWASYHGDKATRAGALGIAEPEGPRFNSTVLAGLDVLLVPAMAVDRRGFRLGKGAGYYDRALAGLPAGGPLKLAVVRSSEVVDELPADAHDVPCDGALTDAGVELF
ncbi:MULTISPECIES: 5-formyltetrahydrofolate cyclo-ligase [unclassified Corynebacterium]